MLCVRCNLIMIEDRASSGIITTTNSKMTVIQVQKPRRFLRRSSLALIAALASLLCACAATPAPNAGGPNPNAPPYPVLLTDEEGNRREAVLAAWYVLAHAQGIANAPRPDLQPVTATLRSLPALPSPLYLPKVGTSLPMTEEETREALRRFINSNKILLGIDPPQLSLVQRVNAADGTLIARYEQRPFRYPFRNGFGHLEITFTPDRRILNITSTAIPEDRLRSEIDRLRAAGITPRPELATPELVIKSLRGRTFTYTDANGREATYTLTDQNVIKPLEFVVYPKLRQGASPALEFHLSWEIAITGAPVRTLYLDAITDEIVAASTEEHAS